METSSEVLWCLLSCKDTNFKANHNTSALVPVLRTGVCYLAKIRILKQITTIDLLCDDAARCLLSCKDTNFKANHNISSLFYSKSKGVCYLAKIRILKQITTIANTSNQSILVFVILQRYEF